jgi:CRP-like cAMP-binding protein
MISEAKVKTDFITLPRGGYLAETSAGYIQFGSPPETIKDTMGFPQGSPSIYVLPNSFFHADKGISVAELEFPIYLNFFIRQKKTFVVCTEKQRKQLLIVLNESVFGPETIDLRSEFAERENTFGFPDMKAEMAFFRGQRELDDLVEFIIFDANNSVKINDVTISKLSDGSFLIEDKGNESVKTIAVPGNVQFNIVYGTGGRLAEPYNPALLGITCLGPSHGFDPTENTSGFILWINHQGIMVDPPVNSTEWLRESNVNPKLINAIILTHCHADHDAGTIQKILEEGKITIYSTETIMDSFIRKFHALTEIPVKELLTLFEFVPVIIGRPYLINGADFRFMYALHSIPSLAFEFSFLDRSFVYSSDHLNDPQMYKELYQKGILTETRYKALLDFPWHYDIIYHEAGIPPLHTRVDYLSSLPEEIKKKITVYHIAKKSLPEDSGLKIAKFGIENTLYPPISAHQHEGAYRLLDVLSRIDIFKDFPISRARDFLTIVKEEHFKRGDTIVKKNTPGDKFYIIISGNVAVLGMDTLGLDGADAAEFKRYGTYEYFGEASLILNQPRAADVVAETEVTALTIEKDKFLGFIRGTDLPEQFARLNGIRSTGTWDLLMMSRFFKGITSAQRTQLELIMDLEHVSAGENLISQGKPVTDAFIIRTGKVQVKKDGKLLETLSSGDFCGEIFNLQKGKPSSFDFTVTESADVYRLRHMAFMDYISQNPGIYMRLNYIYGD